MFSGLNNPNKYLFYFCIEFVAVESWSEKEGWKLSKESWVFLLELIEEFRSKNMVFAQLKLIQPFLWLILVVTFSHCGSQQVRQWFVLKIGKKKIYVLTYRLNYWTAYNIMHSEWFQIETYRYWLKRSYMPK